MNEGMPSDWRPVSFPFVALADSHLVSGRYDDAIAIRDGG